RSKIFTGQPVFSQILRCIPKVIVNEAVRRFNGNRYYKKIPVRVHLVSLLYGVFTYCNGLREMCEGLLACEGRLAHLGLEKAPARSTLSDANRQRSWRIFEHLYQKLLEQYHSFIPDSRLRGLSIRRLKIIDSTTIRLFSDLLQGVGRNPQDGSRKKGGIKVHTLMDAFSGVAEFIRITAAKTHDRYFLAHLKLAAQSFVVFDKAYNLYGQFAYWTAKKVWFVTRMKTNARFHVTKVITDKTRKKNAKGVIKEQYITISYKDALGQEQRLRLRRITYKADDGRVYVFLTNNFRIAAQTVADIYKRRWMIELLFKQIKQNFPIRYFWGENENAIRIQVYCVLIAQLLMVVIRKKARTKKSFSN
ncbi:MAG: IS4 family transposase, partial [Bacteroidota bacterium]